MTNRGRFWQTLFALCILSLSILGADAAPPQATEVSYSAAANEVAQKLAASFPRLTGYVLSTEGWSIYVDLAEKEKVYPGMELSLYREGEPITHPITGEVLGRFEKPLGKVRIVEVRDKFSIGTQTSRVADLPVAKGDRVRMTSARIPLVLPPIEMPEAKGEEAKSLHRELTLALTRTERFEVLEERRLLSGLQAEGISEPISYTDPRVLEVLAKKMNVAILALGKVSGLFIDLQLFSASTRSLLTVASVEIRPVGPLPPTEIARPLPPPPEGQIFRPEAPSEAPSRPADSIEPSAPSGTGKGVWKGPKLDKALKALVVADVNGDKRPELVVAPKNEILIYAIDPGGYRLLYTMPKEGNLNILSLDAADINGNGVPEVFATSFFNSRFNSFALEYREGRYVKIWENADCLLRCLPTGPGGSLQLYGQGLGNPNNPWGKAYQYQWSGNGYRQGSPLDLPSKVNLYGLALMDLDSDGRREVLFVSDSRRIEVYGPDGKQKYKTSEEYGGTELSLEVSAQTPASPLSTSEINRAPAQEKQLFYLQARLFPLPGKPQFYISKNIESDFSVLKTVRFFSKSKVYRLAWDGESLEPVWESKEFSEYMADYYQGDFDGDGAEEVAILLVDKKALAKDNSAIWIYRL